MGSIRLERTGLKPIKIKEISMKTAVIIDADTIAVQIGAAVQVPIKWDDEIYSLFADGKEAWVQVQEYISELQLKVSSLLGLTLDESPVVLAFSDPTRKYFRHEILPTYKSNRQKREGPMLVGFLKKKMSEKYTTYCIKNLEADDILGILATDEFLVSQDCVMVSVDKDLQTVPGKHYNPNKPESGIIFINEFLGNANHLRQTLVGDTSDGYGGCPGIGPVGASKIDLWGEAAWHNVVAAYIKAGKTEEDALTQARVARILRADNYSFETKELTLWKPERPAPHLCQ